MALMRGALSAKSASISRLFNDGGPLERAGGGHGHRPQGDQVPECLPQARVGRRVALVATDHGVADDTLEAGQPIAVVVEGLVGVLARDGEAGAQLVHQSGQRLELRRLEVIEPAVAAVRASAVEGLVLGLYGFSALRSGSRQRKRADPVRPAGVTGTNAAGLAA